MTLAILDRMDSDGTDHVLLDLRGIDRGALPERVRGAARAGFEPAAEPVPVAPASHYVMGGVATDLDGRSSLPGLFAVGECACTGLHGANRLASNTLTECFVLGTRAAAAALAEPDPGDPPRARASGASSRPRPRRATRSGGWPGPAGAASELEQLLDDPYPLARLIARFALGREESRGSHMRVEFPERDPALDGRHLVCGPDGEPQLAELGLTGPAIERSRE